MPFLRTCFAIFFIEIYTFDVHFCIAKSERTSVFVTKNRNKKMYSIEITVGMQGVKFWKFTNKLRFIEQRYHQVTFETGERPIHLLACSIRKDLQHGNFAHLMHSWMWTFLVDFKCKIYCEKFAIFKENNCSDSNAGTFKNWWVLKHVQSNYKCVMKFLRSDYSDYRICEWKPFII